MERFASETGLLPEQLWDADDIPEKAMFYGRPSGSAMPLWWSHAEYLSLVRSRRDGRVFDRIEPASERYVVGGKRDGAYEMWTFRHRTRRVPARPDPAPDPTNRRHGALDDRPLGEHRQE